MRGIPVYLLIAMIVAIAGATTNVFQVCAWNCGTEHLQPWRKRVTAEAGTRLRSWLSRLATWFRGPAGQFAAAAAVMLAIAVLLAHAAPHGVLAAHTVVGLKAFRQKDAELHAELTKLKKDRAAIGEKAMTEDRAMTAEEREKFLALGKDIDKQEERISEHKEMLEAAEAANEAERASASDGRAVHAATLEVPNGGSAEDKKLKQPGFFGKALQAVRRIAIDEARAEDREMVKLMAGPTGLNSDVPSEGGFAIAPNWSNSIITRAYDVGAVLGLVDRMTITQGNNMNLPAIDETSRADGSRYGGIASGWLGQGNGLTSGKPKMRLMELKLRKAGAFVYQTDELIADAPALQQWVEKYVPLELAFRAEDGIVNGDGSNKPQGILNSAAKIPVTRNTAGRVLYEDVSGMWKRMWAPLRKGAVWMVDQSVEQDLEQLQITIGAAGVLAPIYRPAGITVGPDGTQGYSPATLYGRPILTTEYGANISTEGDVVLWAPQEYQVIDKGAVDQMVSLHVAFLTDEAVWRFIYRMDGELKWNAPLTPKSGGSTLSSVVTLSTL